jgi:hypothetical protein
MQKLIDEHDTASSQGEGEDREVIGAVTAFHVVPFHRSATVLVVPVCRSVSLPTAMHQVVDTQEMEYSPGVPDGSGILCQTPAASCSANPSPLS